MSKGISDSRICEKCGYVLSPFEMDCPKCAHLATAPSTGDAITGKPDPQHKELTTYKERVREARRRRQVIVIILSLVGGGICAFPIFLFYAFAAGPGGMSSSLICLSVVWVLFLTLQIYLIINRYAPFSPHEEILIVNTEYPRYTKSDWVKFLASLVALLFISFLLIIPLIGPLLMIMFPLLIILGIIGLILIFIFGEGGLPP